MISAYDENLNYGYGWSLFGDHDGHCLGVSDGFLTNPGNGVGYDVCGTSTGDGESFDDDDAIFILEIEE